MHKILIGIVISYTCKMFPKNYNFWVKLQVISQFVIHPVDMLLNLCSVGRILFLVENTNIIFVTQFIVEENLGTLHE